MADFGLYDPFYIDDGQLDDISKVDCFTLGVEWQQVISDLDLGKPIIQRLVHSANQERLDKAISKRGKQAKWNWSADDVGEQWVYLTVNSHE